MVLEEINNNSNAQITESIFQLEKEIFDLQFKKATRQSFKPHKIKKAKRRLVKLKMLLTKRLDNLEKSQGNILNKLIKK